ncbi:tyrosine-type recombinase/integrase [Xylanimonas cellulosilytica]|uniref:tyrosine-type recombinase/integrase n=1 Tax=Xylanimonas cellulosilytica TaxID=186189 RepID=UPI00019C0C3E|nr:site-specific integrase [Xylanimonas cellulosilytica]
MRPLQATLEVLDGLDGESLAERWAVFEQTVWPRWLAGEDRLPWVTRWGCGVWSLVISRLVTPVWDTVARVRMSDWTRLLPADDPLIVSERRLEEVARECTIGGPSARLGARQLATKLMLVRGIDTLEQFREDDLLIAPLGRKGKNVLDVLLCDLGVFARTPRTGIERYRSIPRHTERELAVVHGVPEPFTEAVAVYLEAYSRRVSDRYPTLRHKAGALAHFFTYLREEYPQVTECSQITPAQARGFVPYATELARRRQRTVRRGDDQDRTTAYSWANEVRTFFSDMSSWGSEDESPLAAFAPSAVLLTRHDLVDTGILKARKRVRARMTSTVLDLQREMPNIRAFALRRWHDAEQTLAGAPDDVHAVVAERAAFWDWALIELLVTSGLRIEEACELTTFDVLKRTLPDGSIYYLLHIKPSKFARARVIPIGDQLGRVLAEIIRHVRGFYGTDHVPAIDRRDEHEKIPLPRAPYLLQAIRHPSALNTNTIRGRLRWISEQSGARNADGTPLILSPHDCRRVFASEHLNAHTPVHVIQALLGHATIDTVMIYAKLYPDQLVTDYRAAMRGLYSDVYGPDGTKAPTEQEWSEFTKGCSLRDMGTHVCALPTGEHCPRGLVCLGCGHAQPKKSALPVFRRMLHSHTRALERAHAEGEPAGQIAARELEIERIRSAMNRAEELTGDAAAALERAADVVSAQVS